MTAHLALSQKMRDLAGPRKVYADKSQTPCHYELSCAVCEIRGKRYDTNSRVCFEVLMFSNLRQPGQCELVTGIQSDAIEQAHSDNESIDGNDLSGRRSFLCLTGWMYVQSLFSINQSIATARSTAMFIDTIHTMQSIIFFSKISIGFQGTISPLRRRRAPNRCIQDAISPLRRRCAPNRCIRKCKRPRTVLQQKFLVQINDDIRSMGQL